MTTQGHGMSRRVAGNTQGHGMSRGPGKAQGHVVSREPWIREHPRRYRRGNLESKFRPEAGILIPNIRRHILRLIAAWGIATRI